MDMMEVRRRVMLSMASNSILNNIVEIKHVVHLDSTSKELQIPFLGYGVYYIIANPLVTGQSAQELGVNDLLNSCAFMIHGNNGAKNFATGPTFLYDSNGSNDYWNTVLSFADNDKTIISVKIGKADGTGGNFLGNHDYYVLMAKES